MFMDTPACFDCTKFTPDEFLLECKFYLEGFVDPHLCGVRVAHAVLEILVANGPQTYTTQLLYLKAPENFLAG